MLINKRIFLFSFFIMAVIFFISYNPKRMLWGKEYKITEVHKVNMLSNMLSKKWTSQDFDVFNGVIFQAYNPNIIITYNLENYQMISKFDSKTEHGDCIEFGKSINTSSDKYPFLYATSDTTPLKVYVNRVTETESKLVRTYHFPKEDTGYYAGHCSDFDNGFMYTIGYARKNYQSSIDNYMIVSKWSLKNCTEISKNVYRPQKIMSFKLPFIITVQGQKFHDGYIWAISSDWKNPETKIIVIDPEKKRIVHEITNFPDEIKNKEAEGISFLADNKIILSTYPNTYYTIVFN